MNETKSDSPDIVDQVLRRLTKRLPMPIPQEKTVPVSPPTEVPPGTVADQVFERIDKRRKGSGH